MKKSHIILLFFGLLAGCQRDAIPSRQCDCEPPDFTIPVAVAEAREHSKYPPDWEVSGELGDTTRLEGSRSSGKSKNWEWSSHKRLNPYSKEEQKKLVSIWGYYKSICLDLCSDPDLSDEAFRAKRRKLREEAMEKASNKAVDDADNLTAPEQGRKEVRVTTHSSCITKEDVDWNGSTLTLGYHCPVGRKNFRLVVTATLRDGTKETNPNFLHGEMDLNTGKVWFDLSKLNWSYLSNEAAQDLNLLEAIASIPIEGSGEEAVATIYF